MWRLATAVAGNGRARAEHGPAWRLFGYFKRGLGDRDAAASRAMGGRRTPRPRQRHASVEPLSGSSRALSRRARWLSRIEESRRAGRNTLRFVAGSAEAWTVCRSD